MLSLALILPLLACTLFASSALGCADHDYHRAARMTRMGKRADNATGTEWSYEASYDWGRISSAYVLCQDGPTQAPIPLRTDQGLSLNHIPRWDRYNYNVSGTFRNWGYGPAMNLAHPEGNYTGLPTFSFEDTVNGASQNESVYMTGWHIHSPADHTVQGQRSRAEMHFVHVNPTTGNPRAVLAFRIDPGNAPSSFFSSLPELISYRDINRTVEASINPQQALDEVLDFNEFWTYRGESSLAQHSRSV